MEPPSLESWAEDRVCLALRSKPDRFRKLLSLEEASRPWNAFVFKPEVQRVFFADCGKELACYALPPDGFKKKILYFLKLQRVALTADTIHEMVVCGDMSTGPLDHLYRSCVDVALPIVSNVGNRRGWPEVVVRDVLDNFHRLVATVYVTIGHVQGKTLLPLPPLDITSADRTSKDKERVHALETAVVTWTRQIKNVLKLDPEQVLKSGAHPGPLAEVAFWQRKAHNLNSIEEQLHGDKIKKVVRVLDLTKSTYYPAFNRLTKEVATACAEANDNVKFLSALSGHLERLHACDDFASLADRFRPVIHLLLLIWVHSKHYNAPARLVVLMREICNDLVEQARKFVNADELFEIDPAEAVERLTTTLRVCGTFKSVYFDYKSRASNEAPSNPWRVQNTALFPRLDSFLERCHDLLDMFKTIVQFQKLEKVEVGGNKGRTLSASVYQTYSDFASVLDKFKLEKYDVLDVEVKRFDDDFYEFRCQVKELERRLGSVLNQGFEDCATVFAAFKLIESFEGLLEREFIQADLERRHIDLIKAYGADLRDVQDTFAKQRAVSAPGKYLERNGPPLYINMPPVSGALFWVRGLIERIEEPMLKLKQTMRLMLDTEEAKEVNKTYASLLSALHEFEAGQFAEWGKGVDEVSQQKLKQPLIRRDAETRLLTVNFDPMLVRLLREVKYFIELRKEIPKTALELSSRAETFRVHIGNLDLIVGKYNQMLLSMLDVEQPLLAPKLLAIDRMLEKGEKHLTWRSHSIDGFVREASTLVTEAYDMLAAIKKNMRAIQDVLDGWADNPLMKRKSTKTYTPAEFEEEHSNLIAARYAEIADGGREIHKHLLSSNRTLKVSKGAPMWRHYVEFVNDVLIDGLARTVSNSLQYLHAQLDPAALSESEALPLLEIQLELSAPEVQFSPQLSDAEASTAAPSVRARVGKWIAGFFHVCKLVKRLDRSEGDFLKEVAENEKVRFYTHSIGVNVRANEVDCDEFKLPYLSYKPLWTTDISVALHAFLATRPKPVAKARNAAEGDNGEMAAADGTVEAVVGPTAPNAAAGTAAAANDAATSAANATAAAAASWTEPPLEVFDAEIARYKEQAVAIASLPASATKGWLRVDAKPVRQALSTWVTKWMFAFTQHLHDSVSLTLAELVSFMENVHAGLATEVGDDDEAALVQAMTHIREVRRRSAAIDASFEPLRQKVQLLKKYAISLSEEDISRLETAPFKWEDTKKATQAAREKLAPLQEKQSLKIKEEAEEFGAKVSTFRTRFLEQAPFRHSVGGACYAQLDAWHARISEIEAEAAAVQERQGLFEVTVLQFKDIDACREELLLLKLVWDRVELVEATFSAWRATLWPLVYVDEMMTVAARLQREARLLPKATRAWDVYEGMQHALTQMLVVLPLVQDLRDEAVRERHWKKLMRICGRSFAMDDKMALQQLLELQLQNYVDSVADTVEQARMELKIDRELMRIDSVWMSLQLEYEPFKQTGVHVLRPPDSVIEALDEHEVALQNMMANRYMGFFETQITSWKSKLASMRAVLEDWIEVQRQWCSLEAIFISSEDIREQLPEDAKRFDSVDSTFREHMAEAASTPNPIEACMRDGRGDEFSRCLAALEMCNRSLADYLELKRRKFPRFYFISAADLVDLLSRGRNPPDVQQHFSKFTDAIAAIKWRLGEMESGEQECMAIGMVAADGEEVSFGRPLECSGAVEDWLTRLMTHAQTSLREMLGDSVNAFVEYSRARWLADFPAQLVLYTSQIWWTTEVNAAFDRLEQGSESALKDYSAAVVSSLNGLTAMVLGELSKGERMKLKTLITLEVHARDVLNRLVAERVESAASFAWQSQLKYRWDDEARDCVITIADAEFNSSYEYAGNCGRLVITALTDRCYITLTQALRLVLGGAPAGPAGTGKTETTKDLGRSLAIWVIVQNCSDQMNYKTMASIFSGLAQTGAWGCFDEFNRIPVEVLSVVAGQFSAVLDAVRSQQLDLVFDDEPITLVPTVGAFITMNPGYAGRTELPENLKALFRPCAMVVPDFNNICEIELQAEGFVHAKALALKFVTLFSLNNELLSKQDHYDWGLRAMKGVLRIAGGLKRSYPERTEDEILMRALRDSNLPKFVSADFSIFLGLISDLFPKIESPREPNKQLSTAIRATVKESERLQPEDTFISKTIDLYELLNIRHCVFVLGAAGSGKTEVWRALQAAQTHLKIGGGRSLCASLNPKAVTSNELYGSVHPVTKEPTDGIISNIMREYARHASAAPKWIVLDGDIDAEWIESMNTVMDDNKVLTLVSNERIPLTPTMRLLFEISHLRNASPATVSRAGVLYLNEGDIGWAPVVQSWIEHVRKAHTGHIDAKATATLEALFATYVPSTLDHLRATRTVHVTPLTDLSLVQTLCALLQSLLSPANCPKGSDKEVYEAYFHFAAVWSFGGALGAEKGKDQRKAFSDWWRSEWASRASLKFPDEGLVFDYYIDKATKKCSHWREIVPSYTHLPAEHAPFASIMVPTVQTTRTIFLIDALAAQRKPVMLVGGTGCAKTTAIKEKLSALPDDMMAFTINFNSYTDASALQAILEQPLEKKTGSMFAPPGTKRLVYFIDDFNQPTPDKYGTQSAIELLRQQMDYGGFYDLKKLSVKTIKGVQYLAAMNPTSGSFNVVDRMQRHFATLATPFPETSTLKSVYQSILSGHLSNFTEEVAGLSEQLIDATLLLHREVADSFLPTAIKFHYQWSLRELSAVVQGLCLAVPDYFTQPLIMVRLWLHETRRVYSDRLTNEQDMIRFNQQLVRVSKRFFEDFKQEELHAEPLAFASFVLSGVDEKVYFPMADAEKMRRTLDTKLGEYNAVHTRMDLVLFDRAVEHVCRISRIIDNPRGNALLVGVGGSGKQSLTRLAAFIGGFAVFQVKLASAYSMADFKSDVTGLYNSAGLKGNSIVFMLTDRQIVDDKMLVYVNDMLSSGYIPDLYGSDDKENIINAIRTEVKQAGQLDSRDNCWDYFINKVRSNLHVVICMSPVGDSFRNRCRKFPAITNCTAIDWFHAWPHDALISVAQRFLSGVEMESAELRENVAHHMAFVHESVGAAAAKYLAHERRAVHTTPKSYLELILLYRKLLKEKTAHLDAVRERLEQGLVKLRSSSEQVTEMQAQLKEEMVVVEEKKKETDALLVQVGQESTVAEEQAELGAIEEEKVSAVQAEVGAFETQCAADLAAAEPAIVKAAEALNSVDKKSLVELKSLQQPPKEVVAVTSAVMYMLARPKTNLKKLDVSWAAAKKAMNSVDQFLAQLQSFDKDNLPLENKDYVRRFTGTPNRPDPTFNYEYMRSKSLAAAGLCEWVCNILTYHDIYLDVEPKRKLLVEAQAKLDEANKKLTLVREKVATLEERKQALQAQLVTATAEKNELLQTAQRTARRLNLAERLVHGLKDENERWANNVELLETEKALLVGNVMVAASFIAYIGPFNGEYRQALVGEQWVPDLLGREIPASEVEEIDPLAQLCDSAQLAEWKSQGLQTDRLSSENAAIITSCARFPLIIDPQLQGAAWLRRKLTPLGLVATQTSRTDWTASVVRAMEEGLPLLLENCAESFDAVLEPVLSRATIRKGRKLVVKMGDGDVDLLCEKDPETGFGTDVPLFKLYAQTKLPNPNYIPEVQAQMTLINFTVTEKGLEDQLLAVVVGKERPDLESQRAELVTLQIEYTIKLKQLEDDLLARLANAEGDILGDEELISSLEETKATSIEITAQVDAAKATEAAIASSREIYRQIATRGSLIYVLIDQLCSIDHMYQFSLGTFNYMFEKALHKAARGSDNAEERAATLLDCVTFTTFSYVTRGLFEQHRLVFSAQLAIKLMLAAQTLSHTQLDCMIKAPRSEDPPERPDQMYWLPQSAWAAVHGLAESLDDTFVRLPADMEGSWKRWKEWFDHEQPEVEPLPQEWKRLPGFDRLLIMRALRPDRMLLATRFWVKEELGEKFVAALPFDLVEAFDDSSPGTPIFFLLSPGVDPVVAVKALGKSLDKTELNETFVSVSLGQGQETVAEKALERMHANGGWVMLQNIELVAKWLPTLEKLLESLVESAHADFRVFLTSLPQKVVPAQILQNSIKLTNEPPSGLRPNMLRAFNSFNESVWDACGQQTELKAIIFSLCFFHSVVHERKKFGPIGWNRAYPFNSGDLAVCITVTSNYLNESSKVPWDDLRYIFGEIMYGGHITDPWDRRLCNTYLSTYLREELLEGLSFFPSFDAPESMSYKGYLEYIETGLAKETPTALGLHPNSEIDFMTNQAEELFRITAELQPRGATADDGMTLQEKVKRLLDDVLERLPDVLDAAELSDGATADASPFTCIFLQECERMNILLTEIRRSLLELDMGLKGDLSTSEAMDKLMLSLYDGRVPATWAACAWPSMRDLGSWLTNLMDRHKQLADWSIDMETPKVTWISGLFHPQAFLTAVMQVTARKNELPLDKLAVVAEVTKKSVEEVEAATRDGAYVHGLFVEGARWDVSAGALDDAQLKVLHPPLPVLHIKAASQDKLDARDIYACPVYKTQQRGPTFVFAAGLKTKVNPAKWVIAGVALLMDVVT